MRATTDFVQDAPSDEAEPCRTPTRSGWRVLPWLVVAAGAAFLLWLHAFTRPGIFYSGDGGLKYLFVEQFARGELAADLRLRAEPWVRELWSAGYYPFDWPFTIPSGNRTFAWCPLAFEYLSAPAYALLGWRGLYAWPIIGLLGVWLTLWRLCSKLDLGPPWTALALLAVAFCSPITIYGAMFWEHTLGVAVAMCGLALLVAPALRSATWNGLVAGFILGSSVWFRSELVWLTALTAGVLPFARRLGIDLRGRGAFFGGLALSGTGFLAWNAVLYGDPLGTTSKLFAGADDSSRAQVIAWIFPGLMRALAFCGPAIALAAAAGVAMRLLRVGSEKARDDVRFWMLLASAFVLGVVLVLPDAVGYGGKQFGPRLLLVVFPMASLILALSSRALWERASSMGRAAIGVALAIGLGAGIWRNAVAGARNLSSDYDCRVAPLLHAVRHDPAKVVVVTHQYTAMELASLFDSKRFFRVRSRQDLPSLGFTLASAGERRFLVLTEFDGFSMDALGTFEGDRATLRIRPMGCLGEWCVHDARVLPMRQTR